MAVAPEHAKKAALCLAFQSVLFGPNCLLYRVIKSNDLDPLELECQKSLGGVAGDDLVSNPIMVSNQFNHL